MKFLGIRHGQSEYNILKLCNDDIHKQVPLTRLGRGQAELAGQRLHSENISKIYCSPLLRTVETATIINRFIQRPLEIEPRLCDIHTGFDNQPVADYLAFIDRDPLHAKITQQESLTDHFMRVRDFLDELENRQMERLLLVAHEETLRVFKAWSENLPLRDVIGLSFENCRCYRFDKKAASTVPCSEST